MKRLRHPITSIREPFGKAGLIVACLALVFAMAGGAFAAKGALTGKQKKEVTKIAQTEAKKYAGKPGANGATGPAGPAGSAGTNGKNGAPGTNGKEGSPWTAGGTLPKGSTEAGAWVVPIVELPFGEPTPKNGKTAISFGLPLSTTPTARFVNSSGEESTTYNHSEDKWEFGTRQHCFGTAEDPLAAEGYLCIYAEQEAGAELEGEQTTGNAAIAYTAGAVLGFRDGVAPGLFAYGTWAVTAE